jgi:hypothetical protein
VASLDDAIVAAFVISHGVKGSYLKLSVPVLKKEDAGRLAEQTTTIMEITRSNERLFGGVDFVLVRHESIDGMFFPADDDATIILVGLVRPYDQDKIASKIERAAGRLVQGKQSRDSI